MNSLVILARGLGTRMRKADESATLDQAQAAAADSGVKAMITIDRPFLDYVLSTAADAGYRRACLVIGPEHQVVRDYYGKLNSKRISVEFAIQEKPLGTANAVAAAEAFAGNEGFLMLNSDNYYPLQAMAALRELPGAGIAAFDQDAMLVGSNIPAERLTKFAVVRMTGDGYLNQVIEKPDEATLKTLPKPWGVSVNCWRFGPKIFQACKSIGLSPRGEYEITDAVQYAIDKLDERFKVCWCNAPVLDLSSRGDIGPVAARLKGMKVNL